MVKTLRTKVFLFGLATLLPGCTLFLGSIRPVEEKSDSYRLPELNELNSDWTKIKIPEDSRPNSVFDRGYQSIRSGSIISMTSACRDYDRPEESVGLQSLTNQLFFGISIKKRIEAPIEISGIQGLETTVTGTMDGNKVRSKAIVLEKDKCVYDMVLVSNNGSFEKDSEVFLKFAKSLKIEGD